MPKKLRVMEDPIEQGSMLQIWKLFFGPLLKYKPATMTVRGWMDFLFHQKQREIIRYVSVHTFNMPGLLYAAPLMKVQGYGERHIPRKSEVLLRTDSRTPQVVDVEVRIGNLEQTFQLTQSEWRRILPKLTLAERKDPHCTKRYD